MSCVCAMYVTARLLQGTSFSLSGDASVSVCRHHSYTYLVSCVSTTVLLLFPLIQRIQPDDRRQSGTTADAETVLDVVPMFCCRQQSCHC